MQKKRQYHHLDGYEAFAYSRALGISMVTFAIALSIGISVTTAFTSAVSSNGLNPTEIWSALILSTFFIIMGCFAYSHKSTIKFIRERYDHHIPARLSVWVAAIIIGFVISIMVLLFINSTIEPLVLLFSFGGVFWIMYLAIDSIFQKRYGEIAAGAAALWVIFFVGIYEVHVNYLITNASLALLVSAVSLVAIFGVTGLTILIKTTHEFSVEIKRAEQAALRARR